MPFANHPSKEFILRVRREGQPDAYVGRRYGEFAKLHKRLRTELPGKMLPPLPRKNKRSTTTSFFGGGDNDDASSVSSLSTTNGTGLAEDEPLASRLTLGVAVPSLHRSASKSSMRSAAPISPRSPASQEFRQNIVLYREEQRVSLRAFLRTILQNKRVAESKAMEEFLTDLPVTLNEEELIDIQRRKDADATRIEEQQKFYEIARQRAAELDVYMEKFRQDIVEDSKSCSHNIFVLYLTERRWSHKIVCRDSGKGQNRRP